MAGPLITPQQVIDYTESPKVKNREASKITVDIARATSKVLKLLNRSKDDPLFATSVPDEIQTALILWTEYYSLKEVEKQSSGFQSETFDDYSYTKAPNASIEEPEVLDLIESYIVGDSVNLTQKAKLRVLVL